MMAEPHLPGYMLDDPARLTATSAYRLFGCFVGGIAGLAIIVL